MKYTALLLALCAVLGTEAYAPQPKKAAFDLKKAAMGTLAAVTLASNVATLPAQAFDFQPGSSMVVAEKVTREGLYGEYEVDLVQTRDSAESTFKSAKETKTKKGKYTAILAILVVGSFIVPMAQYFWYVRDDDSSDRFFAEDVPEPPTKKKGWF